LSQKKKKKEGGVKMVNEWHHPAFFFVITTYCTTFLVLNSLQNFKKINTQEPKVIAAAGIHKPWHRSSCPVCLTHSPSPPSEPWPWEQEPLNSTAFCLWTLLWTQKLPTPGTWTPLQKFPCGTPMEGIKTIDCCVAKKSVRNNR
jgi:hypothetical protein